MQRNKVVFFHTQVRSDSIDHLRVDDSGVDRVDADPFDGALKGRGLRQSGETVLAPKRIPGVSCAAMKPADSA